MPNKHANITLHKQIAEFIKAKIANGEWTVGSKIPTQRDLAKEFNVNRSTVIAALEELHAEGLIAGSGRNGTKIINNTWSLLTSSVPPNWHAYVQSGMYKPNLPTIQEINQAEFLPNIIRLGTGELSPELIPKTMMQEVFIRASAHINSFGYEEPKGLLALRERISIYLQSLGIHASPPSILIVSGALQALHLISIGLLQRGATILVEQPSYLNSVHVFQSAGMHLHGIPMDDQGVLPTSIAQEKRRYNGSLLYTIPSFHNPTGRLMSTDRREKLLEVCQLEQLPIIEDDVYRELWLDTETPKPLKARDNSGLVLYVGSLSKTLSPGLRIGWVVGPEPVIERLADIKMQTDYGSSSLSQAFAAELLSGEVYQQHLTILREKLRLRREVALQALETYCADIASWQIPQGGFYIWLKIHPRLSMRNLFEQALKEGILLNPGNIYDRNDYQHLRLSYAYASIEDLQKGIERIGKMIKSNL